MTMTTDILDVRLPASSDADDEHGLRASILAGLAAPAGQKSLPTMLLYDAHGLRLYDDITAYADVYYPFPEEEKILKERAGEIVRLMRMRDGEGEGERGVLLELGAGALRKTSHLLLALAALSPSARPKAPFTYYALDLEHSELDRTLTALHDKYGARLAGRVAARGMCGTYEGGIAWVERGGLAGPPAAPSSKDSDDDEEDEDEEEQKEDRPRGRNAVRRTRALPPSPSRSSTPPLSLSNFSHAPSTSSTTSSSPPTPSSSPARTHSHHHQRQTPLPPRHLPQPPLHMLFLGSSLGNFPRGDAPAFLRSLPLRPGSGDTLLLGLDGRNEKERVERAYSPEDRWTSAFILNGLRGVGRELGGGEGVWDVQRWEYVGRYNEEEGRHEAYYRSPQPVSLPAHNISIAANEEINIEYSYKYSPLDAARLFSASSLRPIATFPSASLNNLTHAPLYTLYLLERPAFHVPLLPALSLSLSPSPAAERVRAGGAPTMAEWRELWKCWDAITVGMIPPGLMHERPIDLRHKCLFYLGHIPAFLDIHLARMTGEGHTEPEYYKDIFERGIDPNVDDPTQIHDHSIVPERDEDWPTLSDILAFRDRVRARLSRLYTTFSPSSTRRVGRVLSMVFEHEIMHAETLLYMLIQSPNARPPPGFCAPPFAHLALQAPPPPPSGLTLELEPCTVRLGHRDVEAEDKEGGAWDAPHEFGWDNESPEWEGSVGRVRVEVRPVTNGEYRAWWEREAEEKGRRRAMPASWIDVGGEIQVRTLYGPIPFSQAEHWPAQASHDDLSAFARSKGGRLPTEPELRRFLDLTDAGELANVGFKNWHPVPPYWDEREKRGHNGGVWEWTTTKLEAHEGFVPSELYPGYSSDFHDGQHYVALGGSFATHPRLAQRRSFRNWYQHNYPYAWIGGRVVYDVPEQQE